MSAFVTVSDAPTPTVEPVIEVDAFWPSIDPAKLRGSIKGQEAIAPPRLLAAIEAALMTALLDLDSWAACQQAASFSKLDDVPARKIGTKSVKVLAWYRAIACLAKAELVERTRDLDTTAAGDRRADAMDPTVVDLRRDATHAIRDILGRGRTTVDLI